jgi:hypothetical protein
LTIALVVGLAGGASLGAIGAARRTSSAYARMRADTNAWDVEVSPNLGSQSQLRMADIRRLPGVETAGQVQGYLL